jgi:L-ascorbate metabolism protein UlaG (beta-lactamase superfamily)
MPPKKADPSDGLLSKISNAREAYPSLWSDITTEWAKNVPGDHAWLTYSANYLLQTSGLRWAIDPFSGSSRIKDVPQPDFAQDLQTVKLVVLTHSHNDHLDLALLREIAGLPIKWIIPDHMLNLMMREVPINREKIIVPVSGYPIIFDSVKITPFNSLHFHARGGIPETGYLVEFTNKRWLFPGDIRDLDHTKLPDFGRLDGIFSHLWLGKAEALAPIPSKLDAFCEFFNTLAPARLVITHLNELGRDETELWTESHFALVAEKFQHTNPNMQVEMALMGSTVDL